jgi:hypothetical protein
MAPYQPKSWYDDEWLITARDDGMNLEGSRSDLVVLKLTEHSGSGYIWQLSELADAGLTVVQDIRLADADEELIGGVVFRSVMAESENGASGHVCLREVRPWQPTGERLQFLGFDVDVSGPVQSGLPRHSTALRSSARSANFALDEGTEDAGMAAHESLSFASAARSARCRSISARISFSNGIGATLAESNGARCGSGSLSCSKTVRLRCR